LDGFGISLDFLNGSKDQVAPLAPRSRRANSYCCESDDVGNRGGNVLSDNAVSSSDLRVPCLMHMNIINMHGRNARMGSNPAVVSQVQFKATPETTIAPEKRYSAKLCRTK